MASPDVDGAKDFALATLGTAGRTLETVRRSARAIPRKAASGQEFPARNRGCRALDPEAVQHEFADGALGALLEASSA